MPDDTLRKFISNLLDSEWEQAGLSTREMMLSMGWKPFPVDKNVLDDCFDKSFSETLDAIYEAMMERLKQDELTPVDGYELLLWELSGEKPPSRLMSYPKVADKLNTILADETANWVAESFQCAKEKRR